MCKKNYDIHATLDHSAIGAAEDRPVWDTKQENRRLRRAKALKSSQPSICRPRACIIFQTIAAPLEYREETGHETECGAPSIFAVPPSSLESSAKAAHGTYACPMPLLLFRFHCTVSLTFYLSAVSWISWRLICLCFFFHLFYFFSFYHATKSNPLFR